MKMYHINNFKHKYMYLIFITYTYLLNLTLKINFLNETHYQNQKVKLHKITG